MRERRSKLILVAALSILLMAMIEAVPSSGTEPKVSQVVYITRSKACGCMAKSVKAADALVSQTFTGPRQALLKRIDYDSDRQAAAPYIGEYRLIQLPALIFLDGQQHLLWMTMGNVADEDITGKLSQFGG